MLTNYLKIAFRNLLRNKFYASLDVPGRALGMSNTKNNPESCC